MTAVWPMAVPGHLKLMLMALADNADEDTGECWPSYTTLSRKCSVSKRTAIRQVQELADLGFLSIDRRVRNDGSDTSNLFTLDLKRLTAAMSPPSDNMSPPSDAGDTGGGDTGVTPRTINTNLQGTIPPLPPEIDPAVWTDLDEYRQSTAALRKGWTPKAQAIAVKKLRAMTPEQQREAVDNTILNGWTGIFPPKNPKPTQAKSPLQRAEESLYGPQSDAPTH